MSSLYLYNSYTRQKEKFEPSVAGHVGLYVCGPTVSGESHLGHARPYITFDIVNRYFTHLGYKVRYVRNITDVGHIVDDVDEGEDKIAKKARLEQLEPMEVVQRYTVDFHEILNAFNFFRDNWLTIPFPLVVLSIVSSWITINSPSELKCTSSSIPSALSSIAFSKAIKVFSGS